MKISYLLSVLSLITQLHASEPVELASQTTFRNATSEHCQHILQRVARIVKTEMSSFSMSGNPEDTDTIDIQIILTASNSSIGSITMHVIGIREAQTDN